MRVCEEAGLEVIVSSIGEWIKYVSYRNLEDALRYRRIKKLITGYLKKRILEREEHQVTSYQQELLEVKEPSTEELLRRSNRYLSSKCGSEALLSIGSGIEWMEDPNFAGVISVMPHGCMPGGIVAAMADKFSTTYQKPWISLSYDGFPETNNLARINEFAELVNFCSQEADDVAPPSSLE